jgi:ribonucleoside-diphosphate reductase alpha chain
MLKFERVFTNPDRDPFDKIDWEGEPITVKNKDDEIIYECANAQFPAFWSSNARRITAQKYFRASRKSEERETSVAQIIERVATAITEAGVDQKYFLVRDGVNFSSELMHILVHQMASFNSPVWFNLGIPGNDKPQVSACFINEVHDNMKSILDLGTIAGLIFKEGSGSGTNLSPLRGAKETIKGGGQASGPVSFMEGYDAQANIILSGGRSRRAARMCILDVDHPDIEKFINCKADQEDVVEILVKGGMPADFTDPNSAYTQVKHQSGNNSVRVTDAFMEKVRSAVYHKQDSLWPLINRKDKQIAAAKSVTDLFRQIAEAAHKCGDPGLQFHDTVNKMNTCPENGEIVASNPCSEFMWHNNSACNLASINLCKFLTKDNKFDVKKFKHVVRVMLTAQDILVGIGSYPTKKIQKNSHEFRPLGLGYANLGGLLMTLGIAYDSEEGREIAKAVTSLMTGQAYLTSSEMAEVKGAFKHYGPNRSHMKSVLGQHFSDTKKIGDDLLGIAPAALATWRSVMGIGFGKRKSVEGTGPGFRNCQVTLLAPTGTIALMMDCDTTGVEPDIGLKKTKFLVGGDSIEWINQNIEAALTSLSYSYRERQDLLTYVNEHGHFEGSDLKAEHLPVFDCSLPGKGTRQISVDGHIDMIAAIQPFLSGAISKTFNMSKDSTVEMVQQTFLKAWEKGLKCVTIYREGSKLSEPMRVNEVLEEAEEVPALVRKKLPDDLPCLPRHKFRVGGHEGFIHPGIDPETGELMELFIRVAQAGSTVGGLLDNFGIVFSKALQYGIPLDVLIEKMEGSKFEPAGWTSHPDIKSASSILDYIARWVKIQFLDDKEDNTEKEQVPVEVEEVLSESPCPNCGQLLRRIGTCKICTNCTYSNGVCG